GVEGYCTFSLIIANFAPIEYDAKDETLNKAFEQALDFVYAHLSRLYQRYRYQMRCRSLVEEAMAVGKDSLFFDHPVPWLENFFALGGEEHSALFLIMPAGEHWKLRGIPPSLKEKMKTRLPLPKEWAGLSDVALEEISGVKGAVFCHKGRFVSVWQTREAAEQALRKILGEPAEPEKP
ncbi:MYG1 family protein, partial [Simkania negevensis]|nr:MYG1 family protein [Simkania negevensis]